MLKDEITAAFRNLIIRVMAKRKGTWTVSELAERMLKTPAKKEVHDCVTRGMLGNNLRVLQDRNVVKGERVSGARQWSVLNKDYREAAPVRMPIAIPKTVHESLNNLAEELNITKNQVVVDALETFLEV